MEYERKTLEINEYARTVLMPSRYDGVIPDLDMTASVVKSTRLSKTIKIAGEGAFMVVYMPHSRGPQLRLYFQKTVLGVPRFYYNSTIPYDEDLSTSYSTYRFVSGDLLVKSSTYTGTAFTIQGTLNAVSVQDLPDLTTLSYENVSSFRRNPSDIELDVTVIDGVRVLAQPNGSPRFKPGRTNSVRSLDSVLDVRYYPTNAGPAFDDSTPIIFDTDNLPSTAPLPINLMGNVRIEFSINLDTGPLVATRDAKLNVFYETIADDQVTIIFNTIDVHTYINTTGILTITGEAEREYPAPISRITITLDDTYTFFGPTTGQKVRIINTDYYDPGYMSFGDVIIGSTLSVGQSIELTGVSHYEAVPNQALSRQVKTHYTNVENPFEMDLVEMAIKNGLIKFVMKNSEYLHNVRSGYYEAIYRNARLAGALSFDRVLEFFRTLAPGLRALGNRYAPKLMGVAREIVSPDIPPAKRLGKGSSFRTAESASYRTKPLIGYSGGDEISEGRELAFVKEIVSTVTKVRPLLSVLRKFKTPVARTHLMGHIVENARVAEKLSTDEDERKWLREVIVKYMKFCMSVTVEKPISGIYSATIDSMELKPKESKTEGKALGRAAVTRETLLKTSNTFGEPLPPVPDGYELPSTDFGTSYTKECEPALQARQRKTLGVRYKNGIFINSFPLVTGKTDSNGKPLLQAGYIAFSYEPYADVKYRVSTQPRLKGLHVGCSPGLTIRENSLASICLSYLVSGINEVCYVTVITWAAEIISGSSLGLAAWVSMLGFSFKTMFTGSIALDGSVCSEAGYKEKIRMTSMNMRYLIAVEDVHDNKVVSYEGMSGYGAPAAGVFLGPDDRYYPAYPIRTLSEAWSFAKILDSLPADRKGGMPDIREIKIPNPDVEGETISSYIPIAPVRDEYLVDKKGKMVKMTKEEIIKEFNEIKDEVKELTKANDKNWNKNLRAIRAGDINKAKNLITAYWSFSETDVDPTKAKVTYQDRRGKKFTKYIPIKDIKAIPKESYLVDGSSKIAKAKRLKLVNKLTKGEDWSQLWLLERSARISEANKRRKKAKQRKGKKKKKPAVGHISDPFASALEIWEQGPVSVSKGRGKVAKPKIPKPSVVAAPEPKPVVSGQQDILQQLLTLSKATNVTVGDLSKRMDTVEDKIAQLEESESIGSYEESSEALTE